MKRIVITIIALFALFCPIMGQNEDVYPFRNNCFDLKNELLLIEAQLPEIKYNLRKSLQNNNVDIDAIEIVTNDIESLIKESISTLQICQNCTKDVKDENIEPIYVKSLERVDTAFKYVFRSDRSISIDSLKVAKEKVNTAYNDVQISSNENIEEETEELEESQIDTSFKEVKDIILCVLAGLIVVLIVLVIILFSLIFKLRDRVEGQERENDKLERSISSLKDGNGNNGATVKLKNYDSSISDMNSQITSLFQSVQDIKKQIKTNCAEENKVLSGNDLNALIKKSREENVLATKTNSSSRNNNRAATSSQLPKEKVYYKLYGKADAMGGKLFKVKEQADNMDLYAILLESKDSTEGMFTIREDCDIKLAQYAIQNRSKVIDPVCDVLEDVPNAKSIKVGKGYEGKVHLSNGEWIVDTKLGVSLEA